MLRHSLLPIIVLATFVHGESDPAPFGVLVLKTGSVVQGRLLKTGEDYEVQMPNSRMFVPGSFVKVEAESLVDAYDTLRKDLPPEGGLKDRLALARWCVTQNLISQARSQLKTILALDAENEPARELLRRIDEILDPPAKDVTAEVTEKLSQARQGLVDEAPALAGLPREIGQDFVRRVQPILMNSCATADCHGPQAPDSGFRLQRVNSNYRTVRGPSEKNLLAVLERINAEKPRTSPVLTRPQENHGYRSRPVFAGYKGDEQLATLREWVVEAARAQIAVAKAKASPKTRTPPPVQTVSAEETEEPRESAPISDPFDPGAFNRAP